MRDIIKQREINSTQTAFPDMTSRVITISSGKGGVGKTNFTLNLAINLRKRNKRIVLIDADFGLANVEVLFGIIPRYHFGDVLASKVVMKDALTEGPLGLKFLSGGAGMSSLSNITEQEISVLTESFDYLDTISDFILIDTGAGMSDKVTDLIKSSEETILVTTPEPTAVTDAYALIKNMKDMRYVPEFKLVVNCVTNPKEGVEIYEKLNKVSSKFLDISIEYLGAIPADKNLVRAVKSQKPVSLCYPDTDSSKSIENISLKLLDMETAAASRSGAAMFMKKLLNFGR